MKRRLFSILLCLCLVLSMISCTTTKFVEVPVTHTDTLIQTKVQRDSIWKHDSIYLHEWMKGDTVYIEKTRWLTDYKERLRIDTVYIAKHDTVRVAVTQQQTRQLTWFERWRVRIGTIFFIMLGLFALYCGWSFWKNVRNKLP